MLTSCPSVGAVSLCAQTKDYQPLYAFPCTAEQLGDIHLEHTHNENKWQSVSDGQGIRRLTALSPLSFSANVGSHETSQSYKPNKNHLSASQEYHDQMNEHRELTYPTLSNYTSPLDSQGQLSNTDQQYIPIKGRSKDNSLIPFCYARSLGAFQLKSVRFNSTWVSFMKLSVRGHDNWRYASVEF